MDVTAVSAYINSSVQEIRNNVVAVLIRNSSELRRGVFYSVSVTCIEHILGIMTVLYLNI
jgi:hypothetical protein